MKLIPTTAGDTLPFNLPGTASEEATRSATSRHSLHDILSSLLVSNQNCPRRSMPTARTTGRRAIARASLAESEWRDSHVRPVPLRLSWNVATTTTTAIFAPPIVLHDCETGTTVYNEFDRRYIVSLLSFIVGWVSKRAGKFIFGREMRKAANPVGQTTAN